MSFAPPLTQRRYQLNSGINDAGRRRGGERRGWDPRADDQRSGKLKQATPSAKGATTRVVSGATVTPNGKPAMTGNVNVGPTLDRIRSGGSFPHRNDGAIFRNDQGLLPKQPAGYYREYVHPTPGVNGPGPQRVVVGKGGEVYYTPDHYQTFIPLN